MVHQNSLQFTEYIKPFRFQLSEFFFNFLKFMFISIRRFKANRSVPQVFTTGKVCYTHFFPEEGRAIFSVRRANFSCVNKGTVSCLKFVEKKFHGEECR